MSSAACSCPITKTLTVNFTGSTPAPAGGYIVKWATPAGSWNYVTPNPTSSPVVISNVPACEDITVVMQSQCANSEVSSEQTTVVSAMSKSICGDTIEVTHTHNGYYAYPAYLLDVTGASSTVNLTWNVSEGAPSSYKPNKFTVYDSLGNVVAQTDWKGIASYYGPWGASLNTATTGTLSFTKTECFYKLVVESYTDVNYQDRFSVVVACPTTGDIVTPTITYLSCSGGYGSYRIDGTSGTNLKIKLAASGSLTNTSTSGSCAQIQGALVSSTGPSDSENSSTVNTTGSASIGNTGTLFVDVTIPGSGYLTINTTLFTVNSSASMTSGTLTIFEVNGSATSITQSVCVQNSTGTVSCGGSPVYDWYYSDMYYCVDCNAGAVSSGFLVAFPAGSSVTIGQFYVPAPGSGYEGNNVFKITSTAPSDTGYALIMSANFAGTCQLACLYSPS